MGARIRFTSNAKQAEYDAYGFMIMPMLNEAQISRLNEIFSKYFDLDALPKIYDTIALTEAETIANVNEEINKVCQSELQKAMTGFRIICSIFFIKKSGEDSHLGLHIDPSLTMASHNSMGIWIPLCDIDETTGRFCILEKSNLFLPPYNTPTIPCSYGQVETLLDPYLTCLSMKAGDALVMNNSMVHCTQKNISDKTRVAVVIKIIDESAPLVTTYYDASAEDKEKVKLYRQADDFFCTGEFRSPVPPDTAEFVSFVPDLPKVFNSVEMLTLLKKYPASRRN